jgi:pilus assembly protein CpaB
MKMSSLPRRLAFFFLALFIAGLMVMLVKQWAHNAVAARQPAGAVADAAPAVPPVQVLVAKSDIAAGSFLTADNLRWQDWPRDSLNDSYVLQDKAKIEDFVGTVVRSRLTAGEPVTPARVVHPGDRGFMAAVLTPGMRAVTVNVTPSTGMAGFVSPGDRVDLILTMVVHGDTAKGSVDRHMSETVLTNLRVLAMDQRISDDKKDVTVPKTATLEVTPKQAEIVAVTTELGLLSLSLRSIATDADAPAVNLPTWDNEATHLSVSQAVNGPGRKVSVVRGSDATEVAMPTSSAEGAK